MILYVDMEHEMGRSAPWGQRIMAARMKIKYRIEDISGAPCHIAHYSKVNPGFVSEYNFSAILLSGSGTDPEHYLDLAGLNEVIQNPPCPILGLCGGWQFMAQAFGAEIKPMGPYPKYASPIDDVVIFREGMIQEYGFKPVKITGSHFLLEGLETEPVFWHAHYMEVNPVPAGFEAMAETDFCAVQFAAHRELPLFGTQFHPEYYEDNRMAGHVFLKNYFDYVKGEKGNE